MSTIFMYVVELAWLQIKIRGSLYYGLGMLLLVWGGPAVAVEHKVSALLTRGVGGDQHVFVNTTPVSGICKDARTSCRDSPFSVLTHIVAEGPKVLAAREKLEPDDEHLLFKVPPAMEMQIAHVGSGVSRTIRFVPRLFGAFLEISQPGNSGTWQREEQCVAGGRGGTGPNYYQFIWILAHGDTSCRMFSRVERTIKRISNVSLGYQIVAVDPHNMPAGIYHGRLRYTVGEGGDLDLGPGFTYNTNELIFDVSLTVTQDLKVEVPGIPSVRLLPSGGWQQWGRQPAAPLTGELMFYLSTSGPFKVYLSACSIPMGDGCGIHHAFFNRSIPLQIAVSLPGVQHDGAAVSRMRLSNNSAAAPLLMPVVDGVGRHRSYLHFTVESHDAKGMRYAAGKFVGNITVMFDAGV